jgi:hypothetical protein
VREAGAERNRSTRWRSWGGVFTGSYSPAKRRVMELEAIRSVSINLFEA